MSYFAKQRIIYYKRFKLDIWGIFKNTLQWKVERNNYYSQFLRDKLRKYRKYWTIYDKDLEYKKKNLYFIIGYKFMFNKNLKRKVDFVTKRLNSDFNYLSIVKDVNKYKLKKKNGFWKVNLYRYRRAKKELILYNVLKLKNILNLFFLKIIMFQFFKTGIKKKMVKVFSFFLTRKPRREKVYYRTPFIYEMRFFPVKIKKYKTKPEFLTLRVTKLFYIIYTYRQLKNLCRKAKRQVGIFEQNYLLLMECKLPSFMYRTSFIPNMFESIDFIKQSNIWINKRFINYIYYTVKPFDLIGFRIINKGFIFWHFFKRLRRRAFIFLFPKYIYISITFFLIILLRIPLKKEIINPISVDMYRLSNYAI